MTENHVNKQYIFSKIESMQHCFPKYRNLTIFSVYKLNAEEENCFYSTPFVFMAYIQLTLNNFYLVVIAY